MTPYDEVLSILRESPYNWPLGISPEPEATATALETMGPAEVAAALDAYLDAQAAGMSFWNQVEPTKTILRRRLFTENVEMWGTKTGVALGQIVEPPVDTIGPARSPSEWWAYQDQLRNRLGEKLCDSAEFVRRNSFLAIIPDEWLAPGMDPKIYRLAVREGYLPVGMTGFDPAYLQSNPKLNEVRGLDALQWLQNLQARDKGRPQPWLPGGAHNPVVKP